MESSRFELESQLIRQELKALRQSINELSLDIAMSQRNIGLLPTKDVTSDLDHGTVYKTKWSAQTADDKEELSPIKRSLWTAKLDQSPSDNFHNTATLFKSQDDELNYATQADSIRFTPMPHLGSTASTSRLRHLSGEITEILTEKERQLANEVATLK